MLSNRRNPLLGGFGAAGAASPAFHSPAVIRRQMAQAQARAAQAAPPPPKVSAAQAAAAHRDAARPHQLTKPRVERFGQQAGLSQEARAAAQDRLTTAALEYEMMYGGGGAGMEQSMAAQVAQGEVSPMEAAAMITGSGGAGVTSETAREVMPEMNATAKARAAFITWLRDTNPEAYQAAMKRASSGSSLGDTAPASTGFDWKKFIDAATAATTAVFQTKAQRDMLKVNIERAKAGLPPMDTSFAAPVIRTQFDVSPEVAQSLQQSAQAGMMNIALIGGAALIAFMLLRR